MMYKAVNGLTHSHQRLGKKNGSFFEPLSIEASHKHSIITQHSTTTLLYALFFPTDLLTLKILLTTATPRQFTTVVHGNRHDHEVFSMLDCSLQAAPLTMLFKTLSTGMSQTESPLLNSGSDHVTHHDDMNKLAPPSQVVPDLPSWTPLRTQEDAEGSFTSDPEVDELAIRKATDSSAKPLVRRPTNKHATVEITVTAGRAPKSSSDAKPPKAKRARFDGVLIPTKAPPYRKRLAGAQARHGRAPTGTFSLVDALARTFDANRHIEDDLRRQSRLVSRQHDNVSSGPQTDVETTEAEDEQLQLNTRLAHAPSKRQRLGPRVIRAVSANVSEPNSEDPLAFWQDVPLPERPVKRLKAIQYETNPALIDAALGTVQAPISWDAEIDIITREEGFAPAQTTRAQAPSVDGRTAVDEGDPTASSYSVPASAQMPAGDPYHLLTGRGLIRAAPVLSPYQSRSAKFRERLDAIFGENTIVRTDRSVKPRPVSSLLVTLTPYAPC